MLSRLVDARESLGHRPGLTDDLYALDGGQKPNQFLARLERLLDMKTVIETSLVGKAWRTTST